MNFSKKYAIESYRAREEEKRKQLEDEMDQKAKEEGDWFDNLPPEKQAEYRVFKITFTVAMIVFYFTAWFAYDKDKILWLIPTLIVEGLITLVCFILWKKKPKKIKFPNALVMVLVAYGLTVMGTGSFLLGDILEGRIVLKKESVEISEEQEVSEELNETEIEKMSEYEYWLRENNILEGGD